jgi:[methyl-Co(III) methanol-specific corrinoid protein]:coenzyme M methyltransferase
MPTGTPCHPSLASPFAVPPRFLQHPACVVPLAALRRLKQHLGNEAAIVGKVFGPWTLGYHIFGVEEFLLSTLTDPDGVKRALRTLLEVTVAFARAQIDAGADALTLADHCTRDLCSPLAYRGFLRELHAELHERLPIPLILHICGDTSDRIGDLRTTGIECFHYDSKVPLPMVRSLAGEQLSLMGGTSNLTVIRSGTAEEITEDVGAKVAAGIDIIGPECAVPLDAPWANLAALTRAAKQRRPPAR